MFCTIMVPGARPMEAVWVRGVRDQCVACGVPFFFKQWGGINRKQAGHMLEGRAWREWPMNPIPWLDRVAPSGNGGATS